MDSSKTVFTPLSRSPLSSLNRKGEFSHGRLVPFGASHPPSDQAAFSFLPPEPSFPEMDYDTYLDQRIQLPFLAMANFLSRTFLRRPLPERMKNRLERLKHYQFNQELWRDLFKSGYRVACPYQDQFKQSLIAVSLFDDIIPDRQIRREGPWLDDILSAIAPANRADLLATAPQVSRAVLADVLTRPEAFKQMIDYADAQGPVVLTNQYGEPVYVLFSKMTPFPYDRQSQPDWIERDKKRDK
jgi:hypothetical protein